VIAKRVLIFVSFGLTSYINA